MGTWGTGLYQDDEAEDLRDTIAVLGRMPIDGDRACGARAGFCLPDVAGALG
jgi:hypothetical protein